MSTKIQSQEDLVSSLVAKGVIASPRVRDAFRATDRALYVTRTQARAHVRGDGRTDKRTRGGNQCVTASPGFKALSYWDRALGIGHHATISAPRMHAKALELLKDHLTPGKKALDVGSGSGFLTACMARMVGPEGSVIGVEHMPELVVDALAKVEADDSSLLRHKQPMRIEDFGFGGRREERGAADCTVGDSATGHSTVGHGITGHCALGDGPSLPATGSPSSGRRAVSLSEGAAPTDTAASSWNKGVNPSGNGTIPINRGATLTDSDAASTDTGAARTDTSTARTDTGAARTDNSAARTDNGAARTDNGAARTDNGAARTDNGAARTDNGAASPNNGVITFVVGDGRLGFVPAAPYDAIHVGAAAPQLPAALVAQLAPGGRLICPVGPEATPAEIERDAANHTLICLDKNEGGVVRQRGVMGVVFIPLTDRKHQLEDR